MFVKAHTPEVRDANPGLGQNAVFAKVAELWKVAPENPKVRQRDGTIDGSLIAAKRVENAQEIAAAVVVSLCHAHEIRTS